MARNKPDPNRPEPGASQPRFHPTPAHRDLDAASAAWMRTVDDLAADSGTDEEWAARRAAEEAARAEVERLGLETFRWKLAQRRDARIAALHEEARKRVVPPTPTQPEDGG